MLMLPQLLFATLREQKKTSSIPVDPRAVKDTLQQTNVARAGKNKCPGSVCNNYTCVALLASLHHLLHLGRKDLSLAACYLQLRSTGLAAAVCPGKCASTPG